MRLLQQQATRQTPHTISTSPSYCADRTIYKAHAHAPQEGASRLPGPLPKAGWIDASRQATFLAGLGLSIQDTPTCLLLRQLKPTTQLARMAASFSVDSVAAFISKPNFQLLQGQVRGFSSCICGLSSVIGPASAANRGLGSMGHCSCLSAGLLTGSMLTLGVRRLSRLHEPKVHGDLDLAACWLNLSLSTSSYDAGQTHPDTMRSAPHDLES